MALAYQVISEKEAEISGLKITPPGEYVFKVRKATSGHSKSGNPMLTIDFDYRMPNGQTRMIKSWILLNDAWQWKLRFLCDSCGMLDKYESGRLDETDLIGKTGKFVIGFEQNKETFLNQNTVKAFIKRSKDVEDEPKPIQTKPAAKSKSDNFDDDDIPF